jgi:4-carboxymuconolactone decarboxylase
MMAREALASAGNHGQSDVRKGPCDSEFVLGKEFVDNAFKQADDFSMPMQELVTEYCWGAVWGREGWTRGRAAC